MGPDSWKSEFGDLAAVHLTSENLRKPRTLYCPTTHLKLLKNTMSAGDCPKVEELPKIEGSLKEELVKEHDLKKTEVSEKNILPSAEDLKAEKVHEGVLKGVEGFTPDKLKQT